MADQFHKGIHKGSSLNNGKIYAPSDDDGKGSADLESVTKTKRESGCNT